MYNASYIGGDDRHRIPGRLEVVSAGHMVMDQASDSVMGTDRPKGFPDYQLIYIRRGVGHFFFEDGERTVGAGNAVLFHPNQPQNYCYYKDEQAEVYWVHFGGCDAKELLAELGLENERLIRVAAEGDLPRLGNELITELRLQKTGFRMACRSYLMAILINMCRNRRGDEKSNDAVIESVCHTLAADYARPITNKELAAACNMSVSGFEHQFKEKTGISPREYILRQRLSAARFLLQSTNKTVGEIAKQVGFDDAMYFSKFFRARMGCTPSEYQKNYIEYCGDYQ